LNNTPKVTYKAKKTKLMVGKNDNKTAC
jgi:hypothetical protein